MKRFGLLCCISIICMPNVSLCDGKTIFDNLDQFEDWRPLHDVGKFQKSEDGFTFECTGSDPYILSKRMGFSAKEYTAFEIEMSVTKGSQGQVFWTTTESPNTDEPKSQRFKIHADGLFHRYTISLANHPKWVGEVQHLRLDPTDSKAIVIIRSMKIIDFLGANMKVERFHSNVPFARPGEVFSLRALVRNEGDQPGMVKMELAFHEIPISFLDQKKEKVVEIQPGKEQIVDWKIRADKECCGIAFCHWQVNQMKSDQDTLEGEVSSVIQVVDLDHPGLTMKDDHRKLDFYKGGSGYGPIHLSVLRDQQWESFAWMRRMGTVHLLLEDGSVEIQPLFGEQFVRRNDEQFVFYQTWKDREHRKWDFELNIKKLDSLEGLFRFVYRLSGEGGKVLHFSGPELYLGERSFGREKNLAVLPGIEYLDQNAVSSSDAVARPPVRDHYMPHPYKVAIPMMALNYDGWTASLLWPPQFRWGREGRELSPIFAVPNRLQGQENHLFGLFFPPVPDYTRENEKIAFQPYRIQPGEELVIESYISLAESDDPMSALDVWLNLFSHETLPEPVPMPRSYEEEIALSRLAYLKTCWDDQVKGWGHCAGWKAVPSGGMLVLLALDEFLCEKETDRAILQERIDLVKQTILDKYGPAFLGKSVGCHVMTYEPAFYWGVTEYLLPEWKQLALNLENRQNDDGSWGFHPGNEQQKDLGEEGEVVSGTISPKVMSLMRLARITGDPNATRVGLKALEALNARFVPRGAQGWECPLAAADILVSGHGARSNLDAYRITGKKHYLEKAVYWAKTGIAFHYLWNLPSRPLQRYATIPIFGTTFFSHSWRGVPVQWCGLVYAYALQELAAFDETMPWRTIARGIVNSAMLQQMTEGEYIGTLPDSYGDYFQTARGAYINPENLMTNLHMLEGNSLNIRTQFIHEPKTDGLRVSANADIQTEETLDGIQFRVTSKKGRNTDILVAPLNGKPKSVFRFEKEAYQPLPEGKESLFTVSNGWKYLPDHRTMLIHIRHTSNDEKINLILE